MLNLVKLKKWNECVSVEGDNGDARYFLVNPGAIMMVEELPPRNSHNLSSRTRIDYMSGTGPYCVLVQETYEEIEALVKEFYKKQKAAFRAQKKAQKEAKEEAQRDFLSFSNMMKQNLEDSGPSDTES